MVELPFGELDAGRWQPTLASGAEVLLGIRPHDLHPARAEPKGPRFPAAVHLTEPLGDVTVIDLEAGGTVLKMALPEEDALAFRPGTDLAIELSLADAHLFYRETGVAVAPGWPSRAGRRAHLTTKEGTRPCTEQGSGVGQSRPARSRRSALGLAAGPLAAKDITIKMAVPDWPPTRIMQDLANERYKAPSGNNVKLEEDFIPWPNYYERLAASLTSGEKKYQMAVSDSQWLGAFVEGGYYMKINKFIDADPELQAIFKDLHPNLVAAYSTYPYKSDNYYGFPQMPDVLIVYYRKDVFCDPGEQAAYQAKYGQKLPCEPEEMDDVDWDQVKNFGEFFRRAKGDQAGRQDRSTTTSTGSPTSQVRATTSAAWRSTPSSGSTAPTSGTRPRHPRARPRAWSTRPTAVKALEHYLSLQQYMPPVVKTGTMDIFKVDELFREAKVAWIVQWIGFAESTITPSTSKVADKVAFAQQPGLRDSDGKLIRWSNIGGQPFVLTTWNSDEVTKESIDFVKWWLSPEIQTEFAKRGGQSGLKSVYSKPDYLTFRPWNRTWAASLDWQKDVWHVPEFFELLVEQQEQFDMAITGQRRPSRRSTTSPPSSRTC